MPKKYLSMSVHDLVDFLLRSGDIDNRIYNEETMKKGSLIHSSYQTSQDEEKYLSEYPLKDSFDVDDTIVSINGRADGVIVGGEYPIIDEIKSTNQKLSDFYNKQVNWHLGQGECYALMYARLKKEEKMGVSLTYISQVTDEKMIKNFVYTKEELEEKVKGYIHSYLSFWKEFEDRTKLRDESIKNTVFPFSEYRKGQTELSDFVSKSISNKSIAFAEAPTGIGKTMSTLYPAIKSLKLDNINKIFYLTAKGTGKESAYDALTQLYKNGFYGRDSQIMAKEKICLCPGKECNPDQCPFAKGYYDKIKSVMLENLRTDNRFDTDYVLKVARENSICPHELQLDLSLFSDVIVCDYNYFLDPIVKLQRYFGDDADPSKFVILIDEAHNLVDRGRLIFSQKLTQNDTIFAKKSISHFKSTGLKNSLKSIIDFFDKYRDLHEGEFSDLDLIPEDLLRPIENLKRNHQNLSKKGETGFPTTYLKYYLDAKRFLTLANDFYNSKYQFYITKEKGNLIANLYCLDPSDEIFKAMNLVRSCVLFSATLSPIKYYQKAILGTDRFDKLILPSPFPKENFNLMIAPKVSVRYKDRENSYPEVACYLKRLVESKIGNYFIYFPSYEYMYSIAPYLDFEDAQMLMQNKDMTEDDKAAFLSNFMSNPSFTSVGLLVLGGAFSEGIDMVSDRLIGVAIIGIGFPQISHENELIRKFQDEENGHGFSFAYTDPGMNKVMQAVGRLIRSETDKGTALLIDDRYLRSDYRNLFAQSWDHYEVVLNSNEVSKNITLFYKK